VRELTDEYLKVHNESADSHHIAGRIRFEIETAANATPIPDVLGDVDTQATAREGGQATEVPPLLCGASASQESK